MSRSEILVAVDLGSSRIKAVVADVADRDLPEILGTGEAVAEGIEAGSIINMDRAAQSIHVAVEGAERSAKVEIGEVSVALDGEHVKGIDSRGVIAVSRNGGEITENEIDAVLEAAKTLALPVGRTILDVMPQEFFVDGLRGIRDPIGMSGVRLGSKVHIVTASQQAVECALRAVRKAGLRTRAVTLRPLAAALAALSEDEIELGVVLLNLGSGTTGLVLYHDGAVRHSGAIGWGAASVTSDIAVGLRLPLAKAEELKKKSGSAVAAGADTSPVEIPSVGGRAPRESSKEMLAAIIEPRVREIFELVANELKATEYWGRFQAGVVLTGGGARLARIADVAEDVFGVPARIGLPGRVSGRFDAVVDPSYAAAVGTILSTAAAPGPRRSRTAMPLAGTVQKMREWVDSLL